MHVAYVISVLFVRLKGCILTELFTRIIRMQKTVMGNSVVVKFR